MPFSEKCSVTLCEKCPSRRRLDESNASDLRVLAIQSSEVTQISLTQRCPRGTKTILAMAQVELGHTNTTAVDEFIARQEYYSGPVQEKKLLGLITIMRCCLEKSIPDEASLPTSQIQEESGFFLR